MITRRRIVAGLGAVALGGSSTLAYGLVLEPRRLQVTRYGFTPKAWPSGLKLTIAVLTDIHGREPNMGEARLREVVAQTNALKPDLVCLLGDFASHVVPTPGRLLSYLSWRQVLTIMRDLQAPLGVHGVLGNHEWWDDRESRRAGRLPEAVRVFEDLKLPLYENRAVRMVKNGHGFWLAGIGSQIAHIMGHRRFRGADDLPGTLAQVTDQAPVVLMAHEPDIFARMPDRVAVTLSGHTHGGQVRLFGWSPVVPSMYRNRYAYGHVQEGDKHLIVSGGLGTVAAGLAPIRFGVPPEIVLVTVG